MLGIGRLLEMKVLKSDAGTEMLRATRELDKWGSSAKKGLSHLI
jgi:hypothetical protein